MSFQVKLTEFANGLTTTFNKELEKTGAEEKARKKHIRIYQRKVAMFDSSNVKTVLNNISFTFLSY